MLDYIAMLDRLDATDSSDIFNNSSKDHAICLIRKLFQRGRNRIVLLTGTLRPEIYGDDNVLRDAALFLGGREGMLDILVQSDNVTADALLNQGLIGMLRKVAGDKSLERVRVRMGGKAVQSYQAHFMAVDDQAFRYEPDNTKHEAIASFNRPEIAFKLREVFDQIWEDKGNKQLQIERALVAA